MLGELRDRRIGLRSESSAEAVGRAVLAACETKFAVSNRRRSSSGSGRVNFSSTSTWLRCCGLDDRRPPALILLEY
jgi:hypothetical protein